MQSVMCKVAWALLPEHIPAPEDRQLLVGVRLFGDWKNMSKTAHHPGETPTHTPCLCLCQYASMHKMCFQNQAANSLASPLETSTSTHSLLWLQ